MFSTSGEVSLMKGTLFFSIYLNCFTLCFDAERVAVVVTLLCHEMIGERYNLLSLNKRNDDKYLVIFLKGFRGRKTYCRRYD